WLRSRYEGSPRSSLGVALRHPFPQGVLSSGRDGTPLVPARIEGLRRVTPFSRSRLIDSCCPIVGLLRRTVNSRTLRAFDPPTSFQESLFSQRRRLYCLFLCISRGMPAPVTIARVYTWPHQTILPGRIKTKSSFFNHLSHWDLKVERELLLAAVVAWGRLVRPRTAALGVE